MLTWFLPWARQFFHVFVTKKYTVGYRITLFLHFLQRTVMFRRHETCPRSQEVTE